MGPPVPSARNEQRVAVGGRFCHELGADHAAGAAAVVDHDLLAEAVAELDGDQAPDHVVAAARRERNDHPHRTGGIILGRGEAGGGEHQAGGSQQRAQVLHPCILPFCSALPQS